MVLPQLKVELGMLVAVEVLLSIPVQPPSRQVNGKCVYEGKYQSSCIIYEVKCCMCDAIYIGNTQQTFKKRMDGHFSDLQRLLKNGQKSD